MNQYPISVYESVSVSYGTTDISLCEQMAITLHFVQGMEVKEHLIDKVQCEETTGEANLIPRVFLWERPWGRLVT